MTSWLINRLEEHARLKPEQAGLVLYSKQGSTRELTWSKLFDEVVRTASAWRHRGLKRGEKVAIVTSAPGEQILGFLGAMAAGGVPAIFSHPSIKQSVSRYLSSFGPILQASNARWLLGADELVEQARGWTAFTSEVSVVGFSELHAPPEMNEPIESPDGLAFVQYSSGTTGLRKAVPVTHAMLERQAIAYGNAINLAASDFVVSWLPLYHDMGLLAALLLPLFHGIPSLHMSPFEWVQRPHLLLDAISEYRGTLAWLPNFAFHFLATRVSESQLRGQPWASVRALVSCSEPAKPAAFDAFLQRFSRWGARLEQLQVSYAMAENTFGVTQTRLGAPTKRFRVVRSVLVQEARLERLPNERGDESVELLSCGTPIGGTEVRIAATTTDGVIGEVEIRGSSLMAGYLSQSRDNGFDSDGWFRTGDLGCIFDGELIVTGRKKDLIIVRGMNLYPDDIEALISGVDGVKAGRVVVFGLYDHAAGTEGVVAMVETEPPAAAAVREQIQKAVFEGLGMMLQDCMLCEPGTLLKSTSGKLSRAANRELYQSRIRNRRNQPS